MISDAALDKAFALLVEAADVGERCPKTIGGPLAKDALTALVRAGRVRSEVYAHNYRVVTILVGEHAGKSTAPHPAGGKPFRVNGRLVHGEHAAISRRSAGTPAAITLPSVSFGKERGRA
jgi:hypothetical protein